MDTTLFRLINLSYSDEVLDWIATQLSSTYLWVGIGLVLVVAMAIKRRRRALSVLFALVLSIAVSDLVCAKVIKPWVDRERPCFGNKGWRVAAICAGRWSFPSNHASNGMAITAVVFWGFGAGPGLVALALTFAVGLSRIYLGVHYPSDVLGGFVVGAIIGTLVSQLVFLKHPFYRKIW